MKVAFVIGHHENDKGAFSRHLNISEWDFYNKVAKHLTNVSIFHHNPEISSYTKRITETAKKLDDFDLVIEAHFNAASAQANGCETLYYYKSKLGKKYASIFSLIVHECTGIKIRGYNGAKPLVNKNDRGFQAVYRPKPPTILIEPFFGSNENDCYKIESPKKVAEIITTFLTYL